MTTAKKRIYLVEDVDGNTNLVRAATKNQAVSHVVKNTFTARVPSQDELIKFSKDIPVEDAGDEGEASE